MEIDRDVLQPGESTTIMLSAGFPLDVYAMAGLETALVSSQGGEGLSDLLLISPMDGPGTFEGSLWSGGVDGIVAGQLNFPAGGGAAGDNPIAFWSVIYTAPTVVDEPFDVDLSTVTSRFDTYVERGTSVLRTFDDVVEGGGTIRVVPAPASLALLGFSGLSLARRRRESTIPGLPARLTLRPLPRYNGDAMSHAGTHFGPMPPPLVGGCGGAEVGRAWKGCCR